MHAWGLIQLSLRRRSLWTRWNWPYLLLGWAMKGFAREHEKRKRRREVDRKRLLKEEGVKRP